MKNTLNGRTKIQISNHSTEKTRTPINNPHRDTDIDKALLDFVTSQKAILDQNVFEEIQSGSKQAITDALNQIHSISIRSLPPFTEENHEALQREDPLRYWFLLEGELTNAIAKGNSSWNNLAWAKINYWKKVSHPELLRKCMEGDEESLCDLRRFLMNEGWWERARNLKVGAQLTKIANRHTREARNEDEMLLKFIYSNRDLMHPNVLTSVDKREEEGIRMVLNYIHYGSLRRDRTEIKLKNGLGEKATSNFNQVNTKTEPHGKKTSPGKARPDNLDSGPQCSQHNNLPKSYKEVLTSNHYGKKDPTYININRKASYSTQNSNNKGNPSQTPNNSVFVYNLPKELTIEELWSFFKMFGRILDVTCPKRYDKLNRKYGFGKLVSTQEATKFINLVSGIRLGENVLRALYADPHHKNKKPKDKLKKHPTKRNTSEGDRVQSRKNDSNIKESIRLPNISCINKNIDHIISSSVMVNTWKVNTVEDILNTLDMLGYSDISVRGISSKKFLLSFNSTEELENLDMDLLGLGFLYYERVNKEEVKVPRMAFIECIGLPILYWHLENLENLCKDLGEISYISDMSDLDFNFRPPVLGIRTHHYNKIKMQGLTSFQGKEFNILLKETSKKDWSDNAINQYMGKDRSHHQTLSAC